MSKVIDYAELPRSEWPEIMSRQDARDGGLKRYFTGRPCKRGHVSEYGKNSGCAYCAKIRNQTPERKAYMKAYDQKPERKAYCQTPDYKAHRKAYQQTPERKAHKKAYQQTPERKACAKAYNQTPERKAYMKAYNKAEYDARRTLKILGALSTLSQIGE